MDDEALWSLLSEKPEILKDPDWEETLAKHLSVLGQYIDDDFKHPVHRCLAWRLYALHGEYKKIKLNKQAMQRALAELRNISSVTGLSLRGAYRYVTAQSGVEAILEDRSLKGKALRNRIRQKNAAYLRANDVMANQEAADSSFEATGGIENQRYRLIQSKKGNFNPKQDVLPAVLPLSARLHYLNMIRGRLTTKRWNAVVKKAEGVGLGDKEKQEEGLDLDGPERDLVHRAKKIYEQAYQKRGFRDRMIPWDEIFSQGHGKTMTRTQKLYSDIFGGRYIPPQWDLEIVQEVERQESEECVTKFDIYRSEPYPFADNF